MKKFGDRRKLFVALGVLILAAILIVSLTTRTVKQADKPLTQSRPTSVDSRGSIHVTPDAPKNATRVEFVFDPMCPGCRAVDQALQSTIERLIKKGEIDLWLTPISFLDRASSDGYSTRAVNSILIVNEKEPDKVLDYVNALFERQPAEGPEYTPVTNDDLKKTATDAGVSPETVKSFSDINFEGWIAANTASTAQREELFPERMSTPTVAIGSNNGKSRPVVVEFGQGENIEGDFTSTFQQVNKFKKVVKENRR